MIKLNTIIQIKISLNRFLVKHDTNKNYSNYEKIKDYNWIKIILNRGPDLTKKIYYNIDKNLFQPLSR